MTKPVPAGLATLADFRPNGEGSAIIPEQSPVRAIAEAHGFIDRNPIVPRKRRKPVDELGPALRRQGLADVGHRRDRHHRHHLPRSGVAIPPTRTAVSR